MMVRKVVRLLAVVGTLYIMLNSWLMLLSCHVAWPNVIIGHASYMVMMLLASIAGWNNNTVICLCCAIIFSMPICMTVFALMTERNRKKYLLPGIIVAIGDALLGFALSFWVNTNHFSSEALAALYNFVRPNFVIECVVLMCLFLALLGNARHQRDKAV